MRCTADKDYKVQRASTSRWWEPANDYGDIISLDCMHCDERILKCRTRKPRTSTSGLGRYNVMRGAMVAHLHESHRNKLADLPQPEEAE